MGKMGLLKVNCVITNLLMFFYYLMNKNDDEIRSLSNDSQNTQDVKHTLTSAYCAYAIKYDAYSTRIYGLSNRLAKTTCWNFTNFSRKQMYDFVKYFDRHF